MERGKGTHQEAGILMKDKKKIVFISPLPPPYMGPTVATRIILDSRLSDDFKLIHLDTSDHRPLNKLAVIDLFNIALAIKSYIVLLLYVIKFRPEMVYVPISQTTVGYLRDSIYIIIAKLFRCKVICHLRGGNFKGWLNSTNSLTRWLVRQVHSRIDGQIVLGEKLRCCFNGIISGEKIFVVPNGMGLVIKNTQVERKKIRVLYLSNFIKEKGILDVLDAASIVSRRRLSKVEFFFAGNWFDLETKLRIECFLKKNPNLSIKLKGPVNGEEKVDLLSHSSIFVFPPNSQEGHPWVIIEAMAAGLPIITTDQGAITESVKDGINGFIVEERSPEQIAEKIKFLIENPEIMKKMGKESRRLYLQQFTEDKMVERLSQAFSSVLAN